MKLDHRNLSQTVMNLREDIPRRYATIDDLNMSVAHSERTSERIFNALVRIENKLDQKVDK